MPNEITIKIKVKDESAAGYEEALAGGREFGAKLQEELKKAGRNAGDDAASEIKRQIEELDPPNVDIKVDTEEAKAEIHEVKEDLDHLDEYGFNVEVHLDDAAAKLEADKLKEELKRKLNNDGGAGKSWAKSFTDSLAKFDFKGGLLPVGAAVGVALSPLIGAGIAGLVVGGFGLGGIVGGVLAAAQDTRVKSAFGELKSDLGDALKLDAAPFVPVVISGVKAIEQTFNRIDLKGIFADLAPQVTPVLNGVLDLVASLGDVLKNVAANSGPVLAELGDDFRNLGRTLSSGLNSLTDDSKNEALALHDLFGIINGGIAAVFGLVNALTEVYGAFHKVYELGLPGFYAMMQDDTQKVAGATVDFAQAAIDAANANGQLGDSAAAAAAQDKAQASAIKEVSNALKAQTDPAFALLDAQEQVNNATSQYNQAVKKHGENSTQAAKAQETLEKALVGYVGAAGKARDGTGHLTDEQKALLKAAGASDGTIKNLDKRLQDAYKSAKKLDGFDINVDYNIDVYARVHGSNASAALRHDQDLNKLYGLAHGGVKGAANGSTSGGLTWTGERGPELLDLPPGTKVRTSGDSMRDAAMGGGGGAMDARIWFDKASLTGLAAALMETLRAEIRTQGGSVQQALGVPGVAA